MNEKVTIFIIGGKNYGKINQSEKKAAAVLLTSVTLMSAAAALPAVDETPLLSQTAITVEAASVGKVTRAYFKNTLATAR